MSLTLLVEDNPKISFAYSLNLSTWLDTKVIVKKSYTEALEHLTSPEGKDIDLVIGRFKKSKIEGQESLVKFLKSKPELPVIEIGPESVYGTPSAYIPNSLEIKLLIKGAAQALKITAKEMSEKVVPDYFPIPTAYFMVIKRSVCPVYIEDGNYSELITKDDEFPPNLISDLSKKGVKHLFVNKMDRLNFVNNVTAELMSLLSPQEISQDEQITAAEKSMELLTQKIQSIGINEETIKLAEKSIDSMRLNVKSSPKLSNLFEKLTSNKASYRYMHTQILTFVGLHIIKNIDWGSPEQEDKICFITFFHDIALNTDEEARISSNLELKKSSISMESKALVEKHAQVAAELIIKYPHAPMGADQLIRQHHGTLNGIGFSENFGNNISPMAIVFIIAEEFTRIILDEANLPFDRTAMIQKLRGVFPSARFKKIIDLLQKITF